MSTVSSISSSTVASSYSNVSASQRRHRPDASAMAEELFSKLDTSGKGYIEQSDLTSALSSLSSSNSTKSSSTSASDIFSELDSNGDGKVTKDEFSTSIKKLADQLDSQFNQARMDGATPPPPPPSDDTGFTKDELNSQLSEIGSSDSQRSSLINNIVQNFDKADTNSDGKVSFKEAMAYDQANSTSSSNSSTSSSATAATTSSTSNKTQATDKQVFRQLMELLRTYGDSNSSTSGLTALSSKISTSA
ncbi:MAG: EF-hand domain-containing protein [Betaproteobacteria bacterium]